MRDIRESTLFGQQCDTLKLGIERLDEVRLALDWAVHTDVEQIELVPGTDLRLIKTTPFPGLPTLRILLRVVDENIVIYERIETVDDDPDEPIN